jgi:hypothetical protein
MASKLRKIQIESFKGLRTLDLFPQYIKALYKHWHDYLWGELLVAPIIVWWMVGNPPMKLVVLAFVWALVIATYYVWRDERLKKSNFNSWIFDLTIGPNGILFVELQIANVGPPASIHSWQGSYRFKGRDVQLSERMLIENEIATPANIHGKNLRCDYRRFETGEAREGWLAFNAGDAVSTANVSEIGQSLALQFTDAFDVQHKASMWRASARQAEA